MITIIIKRTDEPKVIQMTQEDLVRQLSSISGAEIMLEDRWQEGLKKVRTPYVSLVEPDCVFSSSYYSSNCGLMKNLQPRVSDGSKGGHGGGGDMKLAMMASCLGVRDFGNRIYNYELDKVQDINVNGVTGKSWHIQPNKNKLRMELYQVQVGFVPGAIIRYSAIKDIIESELWREDNLVKFSAALSFHFWNTGRRIQLNPNTTYVSSDKNLEKPLLFDPKVPAKVANIFHQEGIGWL